MVSNLSPPIDVNATTDQTKASEMSGTIMLELNQQDTYCRANCQVSAVLLVCVSKSAPTLSAPMLEAEPNPFALIEHNTNANTSVLVGCNWVILECTLCSAEVTACNATNPL
jgi:hypothetical protein